MNGYYPILVPGSVQLKELIDMLQGAGFRLRSDGAGRMVVEPLPRMVLKDAPRSNVVHMDTRRAARKEKT